MRQLRGLEQLAGVDQREPVRNVVVTRTLPLAERAAAAETSARLFGGRLRAVLGVDLAKFPDARFQRNFFRVAARGVEELQVVVGHNGCGAARDQAARRRLTRSEAMAAAFGLTTQKRPMYLRKSFR